MKVAIIGSGPGGYVAAIKAAQLGAQVTVIEEGELGGTCLNWGCIPTKALTASAEILHKLRHLEDFGLEARGEIHVNLSRVMERKAKVVSGMAKGIASLFKAWGVNVINGRGRLRSNREVVIDKRDGTTETLSANTVIIATGSRPAELPLFPLDGQKILSSSDALSLKEVPKSLIIVGAGVIGCEFACIFSEFGSEVTMLELLPRPVFTEDEEISGILERELKKRKIRLLTSVKAKAAEVTNDGVKVTLEDGRELKACKLLVSIGRAFNTEGLGLEQLGINTGPKGEIVVNRRMQTNVEGVYAIGDVTGGMLLAHVASKEGIVAAYNACGIDREIDYSVVPSAIFTTPEIGSVGLREQQCREKGIAVKTGGFQFRALGKAHAMGEIAGMVKVIADAASDRVLGVHIIGPHASDLVHEGALAIQAGLTSKELGDMIHAHPTLSEALMEAAEDVHGEAIHRLKA